MFLPVFYFAIPLSAQLSSAGHLPAIDFSYAGYGGGGISIPEPPVTISLKPTGADDTKVLQAAIDFLAGLPVQENGFRGVLQLSRGTFLISGQLKIFSSGIVLRGSGKKETTIVATGIDRRPLIKVKSAGKPLLEKEYRITDEEVPAGSQVVSLDKLVGLQIGDRVVLTRHSTQEWISSLGMDTLSGVFADLRFQWSPGSRNLVWDRKIKELDYRKKTATLDAPVTTALEKRFGAGTIAKVINPEALIQNVGIENLILESQYNQENPKDEEHAWFGITLDYVEDAWVRNVTTRHFVSSAVRVGHRARQITVENCRYEQPVSETGGYRRLSFLVEGQQVLVLNCSADSGINDFATGLCAAGPNVFLNCSASNALGASGSYESWASGVLYEEVHISGHELRLTYDINRTQAGGWTAANSVIWNSSAKDIIAKGPAGAPVVVVESKNSHYKTQLRKRLGKQPGKSSKKESSTTLTENGKKFNTTFIPEPAEEHTIARQPLKIIHGRFVIDGKAVWGGAVNDAWWLGKSSPGNALDAGISISRFVPGREGPGLTENLPALMDKIKAQKTPFYQSGPAIWYDRRRDDHSITERADGNVWAAFYELPWARSGKGKAWDGLSRYDVSKYNPWYFSRMKEWAALCDQNGIVLYHHLYNNHNLLETASHWIDFPWRPANNINNTGLPEPPPLEGRDRVHVANQFYDVENPALRALHRAYILHVLNELGHYQNIIFGLSFQYSGPLSFQRFFQETVAEWEQKNDRKLRLVLDTSKNVSDSILVDPILSKQIAVIDMRYWHYLSDGTLWAPPGGQNLAFREMHPKEFGDPTTPEQVYRQVREYRQRFPGKAIVAWHAGVNPVPALMAGGAQVLMRNPTAGHGQGNSVDSHPLDLFVQEHLSSHLMNMAPADGLVKNPDRTWLLADEFQKNMLIYSLSGAEITLTKELHKQDFTALWFNPDTGKSVVAAELPPVSGKQFTIQKPTEEDWLLLLKAKSK